MIEACSNCKFYQVSDWFAKCRRFPEHVNHKPTDWCGEYKRIEVLGEVVEVVVPKKGGKTKKNVGSV